jgi:hypothetical protein
LFEELSAESIPTEMAGRRAFVPLQDKYVDARAVACCPSMDLVAVLTADRQLLVHVRMAAT